MAGGQELAARTERPPNFCTAHRRNRLLPSGVVNQINLGMFTVSHTSYKAPETSEIFTFIHGKIGANFVVIRYLVENLQAQAGPGDRPGHPDVQSTRSRV